MQRIHAKVTKIVNGAELKSQARRARHRHRYQFAAEFAHFIREDHAR